RRLALLLRWASLQALALLAYVPWLIVSWGSLARWPAVSAPLALGDLLTEVARVFALGVTVSIRPRTTWLGIGISALILPSLVWLWRSRGRPGEGFRRLSLLLYCLVPVALMYLFSLSRPMYKPKFLLLATPAYHILQAAGILTLVLALERFRRRWPALILGLVLVGGVCAGSCYSLSHLYSDPTYARDDYRAIVSYFNATARPDDALLINAPSQVETVDYYYHGPWPEYPLPRQRPLDEEQTRAELERIVARHDRLYAILWATDESDPTGFIEHWLDAHCFKAMDSWFGNLRLVVYSVPRAAAQDVEHPVEAILGDQVRLCGYTLLTPQPQAGDIVQLTLFWEALVPIERRFKVFAHLVDERGQIVGQRDSEPVGGGRPTTSWSVGEWVRDNYGLALPPGTPPGIYLLRVGMYGLEDGQRLALTPGDDVTADGTALDLAHVAVRRADVQPPLAALDLDVAHDVSWDGLRLVGHSLHRLGHEHEAKLSLHPGDMAKLILFWQADAEDAGEGAAQESFVLELVDAKRAVVWQQDVVIAGGTYPYDLWREGEVVRDIHSLHLPGHLAPATYRLVLRPSHLGTGYTFARIALES
ncbi:MAG: hypothetical protein JXA74_07375, partial [Anaerolineae bacterium]|nr:hypothetical protein [Anaerolineae bacterium]